MPMEGRRRAQRVAEAFPRVYKVGHGVHDGPRLAPDGLGYRLLGAVLLGGGNVAIGLVAGVGDLLCELCGIRRGAVIVRIALGMLPCSGTDDNLGNR